MKIVLLVGLPGSGKSTYLRRLGVSAISSDGIRGLLADDLTIQTIHRRVFASVRYLIRQRLELRRPVTYVDATSLTPRERRPYIRLGQLHDCDVEALFFDVPVEVCMQRNRERPRVVPESAILDMVRRMVPPSLDEGFVRVQVIRSDTSFN